MQSIREVEHPYYSLQVSGGFCVALYFSHSGSCREGSQEVDSLMPLLAGILYMAHCQVKYLLYASHCATHLLSLFSFNFANFGN